LIGDTGMVVGPMLVGLIAGALSLDGSAFALMVAGFLASLTLAFLVKETRMVPGHAGEPTLSPASRKAT
jgi:hypothetical protein